MPNIQVIDGADNCTYDIFEADVAEFELIFPSDGQDIEFSEDLAARLGESQAGALLAKIWKRSIEKKSALGIQGTLFFGLAAKKPFYPSKREDEMVTGL